MYTRVYIYMCVYIYIHIHMQRVLQTKIFGHFKFSWSTSGFNNPRKIIYYAKSLWLRWHRAGQSRFAEVQRKHDEPHGSWWACWVWWGRDAGVQAHADSAVGFLVCIFKVLSVKTIQHSEKNNEMCFAFFSNRILDELFIFISELYIYIYILVNIIYIYFVCLYISIEGYIYIYIDVHGF